MDKAFENTCRICGNDNIFFFDEYFSFPRVTSDCRVWDKGGMLGLCKTCGLLQKKLDDSFRRECHEIYRQYNVYLQSDGEEQKTFNQQEGQSTERSRVILNNVFTNLPIPDQGRMLDVGCGNGNMLQSFSSLFPDWILAGSELDDRNKEKIEKIPNVEALYCCDPEEIPGSFDVITMIHCLEHIFHPLDFLKSIRNKLSPHGYIVIEIPNYVENPFDIIVADHCSHFSSDTIKNILIWAGFDCVEIRYDVVAKEMTVVAQVINKIEVHHSLSCNGNESSLAVGTISWLTETLNSATEISRQSGKFGIFGTAISAAWLTGALGNNILFYVDEDPARIGRDFYGRRIYRPQDVGSDANVFLPFPYEIACKIQYRMQKYSGAFFLPPEPSFELTVRNKS